MEGKSGRRVRRDATKREIHATYQQILSISGRLGEGASQGGAGAISRDAEGDKGHKTSYSMHNPLSPRMSGHILKFNQG